jgi:hypothetical protein
LNKNKSEIKNGHHLKTTFSFQTSRQSSCLFGRSLCSFGCSSLVNLIFHKALLCYNPVYRCYSVFPPIPQSLPHKASSLKISSCFFCPHLHTFSSPCSAELVSSSFIPFRSALHSSSILSVARYFLAVAPSLSHHTPLTSLRYLRSIHFQLSIIHYHYQLVRSLCPKSYRQKAVVFYFYLPAIS